MNNKILYVVAIIVILALGWWGYTRFTSQPATNSNLQEQLENSKELKDVVHSPRNDFSAGSYSIDAGASKVAWKYGDQSGELPVSSGTLNVLDSGRIEGFSVTADLSKINLSADVKKKLNLSGDATMKASTVLPNTVDDAFTVAFSLEGAGKSTSLATGMFVTHVDKAIQVTGDITIDPKSTFDMKDATASLTLSPVFMFK